MRVWVGGVDAASAALVAMYRPSSGRSSLSFSGRSQESSASAYRSYSACDSAAGSTQGRRSRSPSSSCSSRARSPSGGSRNCRASEQWDGSLSQRLGRCSQFASRCSPIRNSESSEELSLQPAVGDERYGIDPLERRRLSDRLSFGEPSLSDVDRSDFADSSVFRRHLPCPQSHEQYYSPEGSPPNFFNRKYNKDYHNRDVDHLGFNKNYDHVQYISRKPHCDGELFRKHLYSTDERKREPKHPQYDREDWLLNVNRKDQDLLSGKQNYHKRTLGSSLSPRYPDEEFRELENSRSEKITCQDMPSSGYVIPHLNNPGQSSEPQFLHTPEKAPAMPRKSILKNRLDVPSVQNFGSSLRKKEYQELTPESADLCDDFPLPCERASQDGSGTSYILDRMVDSTSTQEKRRHSFLEDVHGLASVRVPPHPTRSNLRVIETVSTVKNPEIKGNKSVLVEVPITPTDCGLLSETPGTGTTERRSDGKTLASEKPQVLEEGEKLMSEEEAKQKKLTYLMAELNRRCKQQKRMLLRKKKERGKKKDPLLVEVNRVQGDILKEIAQMQIDSRAVKMIQLHFDSFSDIIQINTLEMPVT